jgi:hypothetical protein
VPEPYASVLKLLEDCHEAPEVAGPMYRQRHAGATYKSLAAIGHRVGMDKGERSQWYRIAERMPLSQRHAGHILAVLQGQAARERNIYRCPHCGRRVKRAPYISLLNRASRREVRFHGGGCAGAGMARAEALGPGRVLLRFAHPRKNLWRPQGQARMPGRVFRDYVEREAAKEGVSVSTQTVRQTTLPPTWVGRTLRIQYVDAFGEGIETSGTLLDHSPFGLVVNIRGARTAISWERLVLVELVED